MNIAENFEKRRCAKLQAQKKALTEQLNNLKHKNVLNLLNEEGPMGGIPGMGGMMQQFQSNQGQNISPELFKRIKKKGLPAQGTEETLLPGQDPVTGFTIQAKYGIPDPSLRSIKHKGVEALKKAPQPMQQWDMAQPHQGFALSPEMAKVQKHYLQNWYDIAEIPGKQQADKPSWQNFQNAIANYLDTQVDQLMRKQRMLG